MAQRIVHYLIAVRLAEEIPVSDRQRFLAGSLLPDAHTSPEDRRKTHYRAYCGDSRIYDFNRFRQEYAGEIFRDDLYLGYYLHLIEDAVYRFFLWRGNYDRPRNAEQSAQIHRDYRILNAYFASRYKLKNELVSMPSLAGEPLTRIAAFDPDRIPEELRQDFADHTTGTFRYVSEAMMEEYISEAIAVCLRELKEIRQGRFALDAKDFAYRT